MSLLFPFFLFLLCCGSHLKKDRINTIEKKKPLCAILNLYRFYTLDIRDGVTNNLGDGGWNRM